MKIMPFIGFKHIWRSEQYILPQEEVGISHFRYLIYLYTYWLVYLICARPFCQKPSEVNISGDGHNCTWRLLVSGATQWILLPVFSTVWGFAWAHVWSCGFNSCPDLRMASMNCISCIYELYVISFMVAAHQNWDRLACMLAKVSRVSWKMFHYSSKSLKPHYAFSNSRVIHRLDKGKLSNWKGKAAKEGRPIVKTCETYINSQGQTCYKGTKWLKQSEILDALAYIEFEFVSLDS